MHFAFEGPPCTPIPYAWLLSPLPTLGRSWPSRSCRNRWCSWCPGEYLPWKPVLSPGPGAEKRLRLAAWPFGSWGGRREVKDLCMVWSAWRASGCQML